MQLMKPTPFVSIIVPVYNAAAFLEGCLESILNQSLTNIEVLVVNDGSTDDTLSIINKFAAADDRVVLINGTNQGVSAARNKGLDVARGEYIGFVDADDWIEEKMYDRLYAAAINAGADWAVCNVNVWENDNPLKKRLQLESEVFCRKNNEEDLMRNLLRCK